MTKGEGLIGLLYALKDLFEAGVIWVITGGAVIAFFLLIVGYISNKSGRPITIFGLNKVTPKQIMMAIFMLFIIFSIYSLIGLTASIFGLNSSPAGGIYRQ